MEYTILDWIQSTLRSNPLDAAMPVVTRTGTGGAAWILLSFVLLLFQSTRQAGVAVMVSLAVEASCCNLVLKPLIARPRPFTYHEPVSLLVPAPTDFSFPSGHTGAAFAAVAALFFSHSGLWVPAGVLAALIGFSRLYLYVHYPSDVLGGVLLGAASGWLGAAGAGKILLHAEQWIRLR